MANKINLGNGIISNSPGDSGTTFEVAGYGAVMPGAQFYATATPPGQLSTMGNSEIVLVTAKATDDLTVTRAQKGTDAQDVQAGWILSNGIYIEDLAEKADQTALDAHTSNTSNPHSVTKSQVGLSNVTNDAQLKIASNLSDLANAGTARTNLGLNNVDNTSDVDKPTSTAQSAYVISVVGSERTATATLTGKTISGASNTLTNIPTSALGDTGWITPTFAGNYTASTIEYRKIGNIVYIRGQATRSSGSPTAGDVPFTLPVGIRPLANFILNGPGSSQNYGKWELQSGGNAYIASSWSGGSYAGLTVDYPAD